MSEDIRWLFKSRSKQLQEVSLTGTFRIFQSNCMRMLRIYLPELYVEIDSGDEEVSSS